MLYRLSCTFPQSIFTLKFKRKRWLREKDIPQIVLRTMKRYEALLNIQHSSQVLLDTKYFRHQDTNTLQEFEKVNVCRENCKAYSLSC